MKCFFEIQLFGKHYTSVLGSEPAVSPAPFSDFQRIFFSTIRLKLMCRPISKVSTLAYEYFPKIYISAGLSLTSYWTAWSRRPSSDNNTLLIITFALWLWPVGGLQHQPHSSIPTFPSVCWSRWHEAFQRTQDVFPLKSSYCCCCQCVCLFVVMLHSQVFVSCRVVKSTSVITYHMTICWLPYIHL